MGDSHFYLSRHAMILDEECNSFKLHSWSHHMRALSRTGRLCDRTWTDVVVDVKVADAGTGRSLVEPIHVASCRRRLYATHALTHSRSTYRDLASPALYPTCTPAPTIVLGLHSPHRTGPVNSHSANSEKRSAHCIRRQLRTYIQHSRHRSVQVD